MGGFKLSLFVATFSLLVSFELFARLLVNRFASDIKKLL